jgi:hypothetical protein
MKPKHRKIELPKAISAQVKSLNLPVQVHDEKFSLVAQGTLGGGVDLLPGSYFISAALPDGRRISTKTTLGPRAGRIRWETPANTRVPDGETGFFQGGTEVDDGRQESPSAMPLARLAAFRGNLLRGKATYFRLAELKASVANEATAQLLFSRENVVEGTWSVESPAGLPTYIQLLQPGLPVTNYAVPVAPGDRCIIRVLRTGEKLNVDVTLANRNADLLLRYGGSNMFREVLQVADSSNILAQVPLGGKFESPVGAAIGAYALLRAGDIERLHEWTTNLCNGFPWLPDGVVILAEHLARIGKHQDALTTLMSLPERGLPFTSSGLTYALNRLRQYQPLIAKDKLHADSSAVDDLIAALAHYANFVDIARVILAFTGSDPLKPSRIPRTRFPRDVPSIEIGAGGSKK